VKEDNLTDRQAWSVGASVVATLGINAIPVGIVTVGGYSTETAMILYLAETLVSILFTVVRVRRLAPANDQDYARIPPTGMRILINDEMVHRGERTRDRDGVVVDYALASLVFSAGTAVFLLVFIFLVLRTSVPSSVVLSGFAGMLVIQVFHLLADMYLHGPLTAMQCGRLLQQCLSRVGLLFIAVLAGIFFALFAERWFILPFAALKTILDLVTPLSQLRKAAAGSAPESE
jgi:hypothetical protein